ncbi:hypothetical protein X760_20530 [Mesorhizobium sp. LSHC422A00]|nr:hypothetical protein X760_20530 [Mesorhizobium sp. LSHC422A00]ESZ41047.1 hypothetical protein X730_29625 [Mesorhizobium sp. L103C565B0]ESZ78594.1 hypothetical protein X726_01195 [Mesorhizobium sp. L103C105A0]
MDLADLRKAFGKFAQEHGTTPLERNEHTKLFLEERRERCHEPDPTGIRTIIQIVKRWKPRATKPPSSAPEK